jgi:cobalt-zinc-cadmium efflux system membrane fusion protein
MKHYIPSIIIATTVLLTACHSGHKEALSREGTPHAHENHHGGHDHDMDHHDSAGVHESHDHDHTDEIIFTREQAEAVGLATEIIAPGAFHQVIKTSGQVQAAQGDEAMIVATANGIVSFINSSITEGIPVKSGEALVTISTKHVQDGDPATRAKMEFETAQKEFQRAETLVKDQIISEKEFEQTRLRYETAKTAHDAHAPNMSVDGVRVTSPMSGYIVNRLVGQGEYVSVGQPIATVSRNRRLQLRAEVSENHYQNLGSIGSANFKTAYDDKVYKLSELNGRLVSFGKASGESFYLPITFEFENPGDIVPGTYIEVFLLSTPQENVLSIPSSSVTEEQGLYFVYLQLDEEHYKKQEVQLGQNDGDRVQVLSGIKEGDKVVTRGVYQVKLAAIGSVMPEGHSHSH